MMDEPPTSTQPTQVLPIFLEEGGHALPVFVEACSIVNRPKLVRTLKKAGAEICTDPRQARIILVDSRTYDGRRFIRDWGSDPNKVVLEYTWITRSCTAGRALMEGDEWGGCLTHDDGLALDADANMDDEGNQVERTNKSPLPTPRVTPVETTIAKAKVRRKSQASVEVFEPSASTSNFESPTFTTPESFLFQAAEYSPAQGSVPVHGNDIQMPTTMPQYTPSLPTIQHHQGMQHVGLMPQAMQATTSQPTNFMQQQNIHPGMQNTPAQLTNFMQQQNMHPGMMSQMSMPMQFWAQMMGAMLSQSTPQPNPDLFAMSLIDAMRSHGMVPYPQTQGTTLNPQQIIPDNPGAPQISQPSSTQSEINAPSSSRSATPQVLPSFSRKGNESASGYPPQVARRSGPPPRSHSPAGSAALSPPPVKKQKRKEQSTVNRRITLATSGPLHSLYSTETPAPPSQNTASQKIFVKHNGEPMTFFVQIDQPSRQNLVTLIKRNGGKIDSSQTSADYAVLYSQSKTFTDLMKSANDAGKTTVGAPFIHDSIQDGVLRDPTKYKLKMLKRARKRKIQQDSSSDVEELTVAEAEAASVIEQKRLSRNQWQREWRKRPEDEGDIQAVIKPQSEDVSLSSEQSRIPSPTPPAPSADQFSLKGRTKYSDLERAYTLKYIQILLDRDHFTSTQYMANRLYQKMPRHTLKSWTSYISGYAMKEEVEDLRKQATDAHKKSLKQKQAQTVKEEPLEIRLDQVASDRSNQFDAEVTKKMNEEDDLNVIVNFFAYGGGDEQDEGAGQEELWQRLSSKESCKTANSWVEFYERHYNIIQERYTKLVENADSQPAISEVEILPAS